MPVGRDKPAARLSRSIPRKWIERGWSVRRYLTAMRTISNQGARKRLAEPRRRRDTAETELAALAPPVRVIELHPAAVKRYLRPRIEVTERLAKLTCAEELFPQQIIPPPLVAGAGIEPATYGL
jgi:hypothetical protein